MAIIATVSYSKKIPTEVEYSSQGYHLSLQPTVYLYAHRQLHGQDAAMRFDVAVKNKKSVIERHLTTRTPDQFNRMVALVKQVESMIATEHFLPNESSFYCAGCPFQAACKAWHRTEARARVAA